MWVASELAFSRRQVGHGDRNDGKTMADFDREKLKKALNDEEVMSPPSPSRASA